MKKFAYLLFAAVAFAACSDDAKNTPPPFEGEIVSFEASEHLLDVNTGGDVELGDLTLNLFSIGNHTFHNVFTAKGAATDGPYEGYLFGTADQHNAVRFGTCFDGDYWSGFALSSNYSKNVTTVDAREQFNVWADKGAHGSATCLIAYDGYYAGGPEFFRPTIDFTTPAEPSYLYMANSSYTYAYVPTLADPASYYYKVVITGYLKEGKTASVECVLINGASRTADWKRVDLTPLGKVDRLTFTVETNEANQWGAVAPLYFAIDEIAYTLDK